MCVTELGQVSSKHRLQLVVIAPLPTGGGHFWTPWGYGPVLSPPLETVGSVDPQDRPKFDLSKMVQNPLKTAPWGQILSFWPFWTSHWAPEGHCCSTWAIYDLADLASK